MDVKGFWNGTVEFTSWVAPPIIALEMETKGNAPQFIDVTRIESCVI